MTAAHDRLVSALTGAETFDRGQVAYLMALAYRWGRERRIDETEGGEAGSFGYRAGVHAGYRMRVDEENAAYAEAVKNKIDVCTSRGEDAIRVHRSRMKVDERHTRDSDHPGGPVPTW